MSHVDKSKWETKAQELLREAADRLHDEDVFPLISAATVALQVAVGELSEEELKADFFPEARCTCPPELLERGGYRGSCPVHALI